MTTKVTVFAAHGWPVDVFALDRYPADSEQRRTKLTRVAPGETFDAYATSTREILIHEVQPGELAAEAATTPKGMEIADA